MRKQFIFRTVFLIFISFSFNSLSQTIINGDFELNNASDCLWNLSNDGYNNSMSNSWSFGSTIGSGLDILKNECGFSSSPSNMWYVSLSKRYYVIDYWASDALSLEINTNLIEGETYHISYFELALDTFEIDNIPLEIGISSDSLSFGELIYSSTPIINSWTLREFSFQAPNNGKFLTIRMDSIGFLEGWNFVDNFQLISSTSINNLTEHESNVFPNPSQNSLSIESNSIIEYVNIYNLLGQKILHQNCNKTLKVKIDVNNIFSGIYILEIEYKNAKEIKKFQKI